MRVRWLLAGLGAVTVSAAVAQPPARFPEPVIVRPPATPAAPFVVPAPLSPAGAKAVVVTPPPVTPLAYPENSTPLDPFQFYARKTVRGWEVGQGPATFRLLGTDEAGAQDIVRTLRELRPTEWAKIGKERTVVEYGIVRDAAGNPTAPAVGGFPRMVTPIDLKTVRAEHHRGVWVVRDDALIHFNFGQQRPDAEQAAAVIQRYGFDRVGAVGGSPAAPALTYLFAAPPGSPRPEVGALAAAAQEHALARAGIPVPGLGYYGEVLRFDPRRLDVRRDGADYVVAFGTDVIARFGPAEWAARDAVRTIQEGRFNEFCRAGGVTFFLTDGRPPTRVPFAAQNRRFEPAQLRAAQFGDKWAVTDAGRHVFDAATQAEAEAVVRVLRHFGFDTVCQVGSSPRTGLVFLAKSR